MCAGGGWRMCNRNGISWLRAIVFRATCDAVRAFICLDCKKYKNLLINIRGCVCVCEKCVSHQSYFVLLNHHPSLSLSLLKGLIYADPFSNGTTGDVISLSEACANFSEADFTVD